MMKAKPPATQLIAERAHQIWMEKGCGHGHDLEDWLQAEAEFAAQTAVLTTHETKDHRLSVTAKPQAGQLKRRQIAPPARQPSLSMATG